MVFHCVLTPEVFSKRNFETRDSSGKIGDSLHRELLTPRGTVKISELALLKGVGRKESR